MASKWSLDLLSEACAKVEEEKNRALAEKDPKVVLDEFLRRVVIEPEDSDPVGDAHRVYYGLASIALLVATSASSHAAVHKLERIIKSLFLRNKVKPRRSQLGHIYLQLAEAMGNYYSQKGDLDTAIWEVSIGHTLAQGSSQKPGEISQYTYAHLALNNGSAMLAVSLFRQLREGTSSRIWYEMGLLGEIKSLRLSGQREAASELLQGLARDDAQTQLQEHIQWERFMDDVPVDTDAWLTEQSEIRLSPAATAQLALWLYAQANPYAHLDSIKKLRRHRGSFKKAALDQNSKAAIRAWETLDSLYDSSTPFEVRLRQAGSVMEMTSRVFIEARCLTLIALYRWTARNSQSHLSLLLDDSYRSLSLRLSQGMSHDVLSLMENAARGRSIEHYAFPVPSQETPTRLPTRQVSDAGSHPSHSEDGELEGYGQATGNAA